LTTTGIIVLVAVLSFVWGGLFLILVTATRRERDKRRS